jgi:hypothetical protein
MVLEKCLEPLGLIDRIRRNPDRLSLGLTDQDLDPPALMDKGGFKGISKYSIGHVWVSAVNLVQANGKNGSPGRTRTCSLAVTSAPSFRKGLDYLITPEGVGRFALSASAKKATAFRPSLCTFPAAGAVGLRSGFPYLLRGLGFPEFTRFFNRGFPRKLLLAWSSQPTLSTAARSTIELPGSIRCVRRL